MFDALTAGSKLGPAPRLFPEIVGTLAIDALADALTGAMLPARIAHAACGADARTISATITGVGPDGWTLSPEAEARLLGNAAASRGPPGRGASSASSRIIPPMTGIAT